MPWVRADKSAVLRGLFLLHALLSFVLLGASTHHSVWSRRYLRGDFRRVAAERRFLRITACAYGVTIGLGLVLYPSYRLHVRPWLGRPELGLGWVALLFEIKECVTVIGALMAAALAVLARFRHPENAPRFSSLYARLSTLVCLSVWVAGGIGLLVVSYRSVLPTAERLPEMTSHACVRHDHGRSCSNFRLQTVHHRIE